MKCRVCPRNCGVDRVETLGYCQSGALPRIARAGLHFWEEPCISGTKGSGAIFFSGCSLRCVFCQNYTVSQEQLGKEVTVERMGEIMDDLWRLGAHNINLVTATHYADAIFTLFDRGYEKKIPIVYNCGGYESVETLKKLKGIVDIYLPDLKYADPILAKRYSGAEDYVTVAKAALTEMYRQKGALQLDENGLGTSGVLIRHLILPGHTADSKRVLDFLRQQFGEDVFFSLMRQYLPEGRAFAFPKINRKLTTYEYETVRDYALAIGLANGYIQGKEAASKNYIPAFDFTGVSCYNEKSEHVHERG